MEVVLCIVVNLSICVLLFRKAHKHSFYDKTEGNLDNNLKMKVLENFLCRENTPIYLNKGQMVEKSTECIRDLDSTPENCKQLILGTLKSSFVAKNIFFGSGCFICKGT